VPDFWDHLARLPKTWPGAYWCLVFRLVLRTPCAANLAAQSRRFGKMYESVVDDMMNGSYRPWEDKTVIVPFEQAIAARDSVAFWEAFVSMAVGVWLPVTGWVFAFAARDRGV
jgi:hypothetical protein